MKYILILLIGLVSHLYSNDLGCLYPNNKYIELTSSLKKQATIYSGDPVAHNLKASSVIADEESRYFYDLNNDGVKERIKQINSFGGDASLGISISDDAKYKSILYTDGMLIGYFEQKDLYPILAVTSGHGSFIVIQDLKLYSPQIINNLPSYTVSGEYAIHIDLEYPGIKSAGKGATINDDVVLRYSPCINDAPDTAAGMMQGFAMNGNIICSIKAQTKVEILGKDQSSKNDLWYFCSVAIGSIKDLPTRDNYGKDHTALGWIRSDDVKLQFIILKE